MASLTAHLLLARLLWPAGLLLYCLFLQHPQYGGNGGTVGGYENYLRRLWVLALS